MTLIKLTNEDGKQTVVNMDKVMFITSVGKFTELIFDVKYLVVKEELDEILKLLKQKSVKTS